MQQWFERGKSKSQQVNRSKTCEVKCEQHLLCAISQCHKSLEREREVERKAWLACIRFEHLEVSRQARSPVSERLPLSATRPVDTRRHTSAWLLKLVLINQQQKGKEFGSVGVVVSSSLPLCLCYYCFFTAPLLRLLVNGYKHFGF